MAFITKDDFSNIIDNEVLDEITETNDASILTTAAVAISLMTGYLNARYDVVNIFNKTGDDRNPVILHYAKDITVYYLHGLVSNRKIPENRVKRYDDALKWLEDIRGELINPPDLPLPETATDKVYILSGSNPKRNNYI